MTNKLAMKLQPLLFLALPVAAQGQTSEVVVGVFSNFGAPLRGAAVKAVDARGLARAVKTEDETAVLHLPVGAYHLEVVVEGFETNRSRIVVDQARCWFTVGLQLGGLSGFVPRSMVEGQAKQYSRDRDTWVTLSGLYAEFRRSARLDRKGRFVLGAVPAGRYVLTMWSRETVFHTRVVDVSQAREPLVIE